VVPPRHILDEIYTYAQQLLETENHTFPTAHVSPDQKIRAEFIASGTLGDKISALTLAVSESPLHNQRNFETLLGLAKKKSRNQALMALTAIKDLLVTGSNALLPADRKLRVFAKQPGLVEALRGTKQWTLGQELPGGLQDLHLISWAYEDWLKKKYFELLQVLEGWCNDEIEYSRSRVLSFVLELLRDRPEQEENLLRLLINKLGDTNRKIASKASHLLLELQVTHPVMKGIIINSIESELLLKPGQNPHAKYYAIITLNQTILSLKEQEVANKLLSIYFNLFLDLLKKPSDAKAPVAIDPQQGGGGKPGKKAKQKARLKEQAEQAVGDLREKMVAQVLTGVNRVFPFAQTDDAAFESQLDTIYRVTHSSNFNTSIQALMLIQQISSAKHFSSDRFYRTLYESLLDPRLLASSKQIMYLNLLYKSLKNDISVKRVQAFVKRLLQIVSLHEAPFVTGVLYLVSELRETFPSIKHMLEQPEENEEDEEEHFVDVPEDGTTAGAAPVTETASVKQIYDPRKRDPEHSNANKSCLWELLPFISHFHPSVSLFSNSLLVSATMPPKPDPTGHTLIHFLDRFAYRNAKKESGSRGSSIMQPLAGATTGDRLISQGATAKPVQPVNTEQFWNRKLEDVGVDEVFFHQYFEKSGKKKTKPEKKKKKEEGDESDEDEDEIWQALVDSRPEIEGDEDDEEGFDEDDFSVGDFEDDEDLEDVDLDDEDLDADSISGAEQDAGVSLDANAMDIDTVAAKPDVVDWSEEEDDFAGILESDDEAFVDSDAEVPVELGVEAGESEEEKTEKEKRKEERKKKKRKLKHLPTFASMEEYAKLLEDEDDGL